MSVDHPAGLVLPAHVECRARLAGDDLTILTPGALAFVGGLERRFGPERHRLLAARAERQTRLDRGEKPAFLAATQAVRAGDWRVARVPADLQDRRVEITGPVDRKMIINALNSGAQVFMADFEDSLAPTWRNLLDGQRNLADAVRRTIALTDATTGKHYRLGERTATLIVRPRGWHLDEAHVIVDGRAMSGSLFDFGLYVYHCAHDLIARGSGPYFYLPKMESHLEARLWNQVFVAAQEALGLPLGTIKATVLIETILAAFEMDEILYELRDHIVGLNCGRWDYIFSFIKKFRENPASLLPDRAKVTMTTHFLRSYSQLLIKTCHRRGAHAIGGMAAQIPIKGDAVANEAAIGKVRADKEREAGDGHDGTWVAHPGLVPVAREVFDRLMPAPHQVGRLREDVTAAADDLLRVPADTITEGGLRQNLAVGVQYTAAWLAGLGCVPLNNLMEDAATAEISRTQVWQWRRHGAKLDDGRRIDEALVRRALDEEVDKIARSNQPQPFGERDLRDARGLFLELILAPQFTDFLTEPAYRLLLQREASAA
ncbi:MAG: malate synthase A [Alphaproteobacteria bacterium]|nr:malate synthase A [Alphaproteobacteria bacterium]